MKHFNVLSWIIDIFPKSSAKSTVLKPQKWFLPINKWGLNTPPVYPPIFEKIGIPKKIRYTESTGRPENVSISRTWQP